MGLTILEKNDFLKGTYNDVKYSDGVIILEEEKLSGYYETSCLGVDDFKQVIVSWNVKTLVSSYVEISISFYKNNKWSRWFSYGKWSDKGNNKGSVYDQSDDLGKMNVDVVSVLDGSSNKVKIKISLERKKSDLESPIVSRVAVSTFYEYKEVSMKVEDIDIEVPTISQMTIPEIGKSICSPTSLNMVMSNYGYSEDTFNVSQSCFDNGAGIYGNWAYNVAYSGECGFNSFVQFCESESEIIDYIMSGIPLVASIKTKEISELKGAPQTYPAGHLLVIRGFANKDKKYIIVNDPASKTVGDVKRYYDFSEFLKVWSKIIYVIKPIVSEEIKNVGNY